MAEQIKYVSLSKLDYYDSKIKEHIETADNTLKSNLEGQIEVVAGALDSEITRAKAAEATNATVAQTAQAAADKAQGEVDALETYVGTFTHDTAKTVVEYVNAKTDGIATSGNLEALGTRVTAIENDYLKASDKTELEGDIVAVRTAVDTEKSRAEGIEAGLDARITAIEDDYLKAADKTELQGNIDTVSAAVERLTNGVSAEEIDGVNDLIQYVKDHGTEVTGMQDDIAENASAIEGVAGRMTTAEGKITAVEGAVATKAEQSALNEAVEALEGVDAGLDTRLKAVEAKFGDGEGNVEAQIAAAKQEAIDAAATAADTKDEAVLAAAKKYADDEDALIEARVATLEGASATHALKSEVEAVDGRVTTAEGEIDTLQSEMDAVEALAVAADAAAKANAQAIALKADITALNAVSDRVTTLETWHNNFTEASEEEINALFA